MDVTLTKRITNIINEIRKDIRLGDYIPEELVLEYNEIVEQLKGE